MENSLSEVKLATAETPKRVDDIISQQTAKSGSKLLLVSAAAVFSKLFDVRIDKLGAVSAINVDRLAVDWVLLLTIAYLMYAHITNWNVDREAGPPWFDMSNFFGDHPDAYGSGQWWHGSVKGCIINAWLHLRGSFGYSPWSWMMSLIFIKHLILPVCLGAIGIGMLVVSMIFSPPELATGSSILLAD